MVSKVYFKVGNYSLFPVTVRFWMMEWWKVLRSWRWQRERGYFSRTIIQNTPPDWRHSSLRTTTFKYWSGLYNLLTSTPLNTCGCT